MSGNVSALPALNTASPDPRTHAERSNRLIRQFNRLEQDLFVPMYATDTGSATAYTIQVSADLKAYKVGQEYHFKATNANSNTAPTLNANGLGAGTIFRMNGSALSIGDIAANQYTPVICTAISPPTFALLYQPPASIAQTFLGADVLLNNTATTFDGPNTGAFGASGQVWKITGKASVVDTGGAAGFVLKLTDGTTEYDSGTVTTGGAAFEEVVPLAAKVTLAGAATLKITARDVSAATGKLLTTGASGTANKATWIMAERVS